MHQHLGRPSQGSVRRNEIRSLEEIPPLGGIARLEETQLPGRTCPPREVRPQKETPRLKLKLLMRSMLVLLPALMQADELQLKGSYLPLGRSALPALGVTIQRSRESLGSPVPPAEEGPPPPHTANGEMSEPAAKREAVSTPLREPPLQEGDRGETKGEPLLLRGIYEGQPKERVLSPPADGCAGDTRG